MKTSDVYLASALLALGFALRGVDRADPRHMVFEFAIPEGVYVPLDFNDVQTQWANETLVINARKFSSAIKGMKSLIHSS
jgi:hypothetical protein